MKKDKIITYLEEVRIMLRDDAPTCAEKAIIELIEKLKPKKKTRAGLV